MTERSTPLLRPHASGASHTFSSVACVVYVLLYRQRERMRLHGDQSSQQAAISGANSTLTICDADYAVHRAWRDRSQQRRLWPLPRRRLTPARALATSAWRSLASPPSRSLVAVESSTRQIALPCRPGTSVGPALCSESPLDWRCDPTGNTVSVSPGSFRERLSAACDTRRALPDWMIALEWTTSPAGPAAASPPSTCPPPGAPKHSSRSSTAVAGVADSHHASCATASMPATSLASSTSVPAAENRCVPGADSRRASSEAATVTAPSAESGWVPAARRPCCCVTDIISTATCAAIETRCAFATKASTPAATSTSTDRNRASAASSILPLMDVPCRILPAAKACLRIESSTASN